ncbi:hypothetical protein ACA910_005956 [Epithemia clementina (nom. ined.)]
MVVGTDGRRSLLINELQSSVSPPAVLDRVGRYVSPEVDPDGEIARLVLVRLAKQWIALDNQGLVEASSGGLQSILRHSYNDEFTVKTTADTAGVIDAVVCSLLESTWKVGGNVGNLVEGTKALSVIARLLPWVPTASMHNFWYKHADEIVPHLKEDEITGIFWAIENLVHASNRANLGQTRTESVVPDAVKRAWMDLNLPFRVIPGLLSHLPNLTVPNLCHEVDFCVDQIQTVSKKFVTERRETSWQGDEGVAPFVYGGKAMPTQPWSPTVLSVRDCLSDPQSGHQQYYDCTLINHYPDGESAMRYHSDPDQGVLWDYDTAVVSVGATRRFAFRKNPSKQKKLDGNRCNSSHHSFILLHGDVTHMFGSCQENYQHCVKKAESKSDDAARISLVFKRSWGLRQALQ